VHRAACGSGVVIAESSSKGAGLGIVALRDFAGGQLVLSEKPVISVPHDCDLDELEETMARPGSAVNSLKPATKAALFMLFDRYQSRNDDRKTFTGILETNGIPHGVDGCVGGLFLFLSRLNHSCAPNCARSWNDDLQREELIALCDIAKGEELTSAYFDIIDDRPHRRKHALELFEFECMCDACRLETDDTWKRKAKEHDDLFQENMTLGNFTKALEHAESRLKLLKDNDWNNPGDFSRTYFDAYTASREFKQKAKTLEFITKAIEMSALIGMENHVDTKMMRRLKGELLSS